MSIAHDSCEGRSLWTHGDISLVPGAERESDWYTLMQFLLIENGVAHVYDINTIQAHVLWWNLSKVVSSKHPYLDQLASVCRLCGSSVAYSHHTVALFDKKFSQEKLASSISAVLYITLNNDDGLPNLICKV